MFSYSFRNNSVSVAKHCVCGLIIDVQRLARVLALFAAIQPDRSAVSADVRRREAASDIQNAMIIVLVRIRRSLIPKKPEHKKCCRIQRGKFSVPGGNKYVYEKRRVYTAVLC